MEKTLGGDRLGSGKKMKVYLHGYERSTHDMGYLWRSTMAAGTLVPFMVEVALPGDTFDINLDADIKTHPTIGPLFGSYKAQFDIFQAPVRLYQGDLHNNKLGIGMNMAQIKLPVLNLAAAPLDAATIPETDDLDNLQINPSCLLAYLGIRGIGIVPSTESYKARSFNGIPLLAYWDIYKNYYANKQEEIGAALNTPSPEQTIDSITIGGATIDEYPNEGLEVVAVGEAIIVTYTGTAPAPEDIFINHLSPQGERVSDPLTEVANNIVVGATITANWNSASQGVYYWTYASAEQRAPQISTFPLENIDEMRTRIMQETGSGVALSIGGQSLAPYTYVSSTLGAPVSKLRQSQQGLGLKTYQSDLFNNWLQTEWIDGAGGITEVTAVDTSGGSFTLDTLNLSKKVYDMLNRIAVSGGTYDDWLDAVYTHDRYTRCESPMYMGGLIKELVFQEVVSNSESAQGQPLGTLAGRGVLGKKHKGGRVTIKVDEPSYIIGIVSLTPRVDYSQGNKWDTHLLTMDDFHKPALDEIGFQELITEQMAWWSTQYDTVTDKFIQLSAGKQPAWLNYMTNVNRVYGNFAIENNEMFMTLNRRYEHTDTGAMEDLTTYIDPVKYNHIFAQTSRDAQNFWTQIAVDITARRKMSAKIMPNL